MLRLRTLGRIRLQKMDGEELLAGHRKELVLLAYLAMRGGRAAARAELAELLWSDREASKARHSLRQALASLRSVLNSNIDAGPDEVRLLSGSIEVDVAKLLAELSAKRLDESTAEWRSAFLADAEDLGGESYRAWLESEREAIRRQIALAFEKLHADARRQALWFEALFWAERWAEMCPHEERAQLALLEALQRSGRTSDALAHHRTITEQLRQQLGVEPSADFRARGEEIERNVRSGWKENASPGSAALFSPDLIGRDAALIELTATWQAVRTGDAAVAVVEGEAGLGKTRLCTEFLRRLEGENPAPFVLRARAVANVRSVGAAATAHTLLHDLLANMRAAPALDDAANRDLALLTTLAPTLRDRFPHLPALEQDVCLLPGVLARVLAVVAHEQPVILFVDDFTSADTESQDFIAALVERLPAGRVLLLLSIEVEERARTRALVGLYESRRVRRVRLRSLDAAELEAVVASMIACPDDVRRMVARRLHAETGGNPRFATEMLASLVDDGRLLPDADGRWHLTADLDAALPLPATVRDAMRRRLERLSEAGHRLLRVAAVAAEPWDLATVGSSSGLTPEQIGLAIDELVARRFVQEELERSGHVRYRLSHAVLRRIVVENGFAKHGAAASALPRKRSLRPAVNVTLTIAALTAFALLTQFAFRQREERSPVLAVGLIHDYSGSDSAGLANALPEMLATNLARVRELRVVSHARLYEISGQLGERNATSAALARAARQAGAQELIEGELYTDPGGTYRLDLRRIVLANGGVRRALRITGRDIFSLIDDATARLATDFGKAAEELHLADVTTRSVVAYRLYEEGLRGYYQGDFIRAATLFRAAFKEDSTFVLPAYYFVLAQQAAPLPVDSAIETRLLKLADHAPDRERLLMRARLAVLANEPAALALAETLTIRYPEEPDGHLLRGQALAGSGRVVEALPHLRYVLSIDSLGLRGTSPSCRACDAYSAIIDGLITLDSVSAAETLTREWIRVQPAAAQPWGRLAHLLEAQGLTAEALAARNRAASYEPGQAYDHVFPGMLAIRAGDFASADALLREQSRTAPPEVQREAIWFLVISLRYQGRFAEALQEARRIRTLDATPNFIPEGQVLFEMGRPIEAAAFFRRMVNAPRRGLLGLSPGMTARNRAWFLTQTATALAAAHDTSALAALADTIEKVGALSLFGRDHHLHHHVRGLLYEARGSFADAAEAFRAAANAPPALYASYNRTSFELARALLALGQPQEAVRALHIALNGTLEASNYYLSRSDARALLGRAFEALGQRDSAIAQYRWTLNAWRKADPVLIPRRDSIRARLEALVAAHVP